MTKRICKSHANKKKKFSTYLYSFTFFLYFCQCTFVKGKSINILLGLYKQK